MKSLCGIAVIATAIAASSTCIARPALTQPTDTRTCGVARGRNLVVFVGRKIDIHPFQPALAKGAVLMDAAFRARYQVIHVVCGALTGPEIEFEVYDHYGLPAFAEHETVLLFVSRHDRRFVHEKYQYSDVYETTEGSWAGCGDPYALEPSVHRGPIQAQPVSYKRAVTFPTAGLSDPEVARRYPAAFFERRADSVVCTHGAPLADLFAVKRNGVLKARGLFR